MGGLIALVLAVITVIIIAISSGKKEKKRIASINNHLDEWGERFVKTLISSKIPYYRAKKIMEKRNELGDSIIESLIWKNIKIGMDEDMLWLALGAPTSIDNKEETANSKKKRFVYGIPRKGAQYYWIKDGIITKIKK